MPRRLAATLIAIATALAATAVSASAPDGIELLIDPAETPGQLALSWTGGLPTYLVYRSQVPSAVVTASTRIATTAGTALNVPEGSETIDYFLVVNVDRASPVTTSSACLTAGTNAQGLVTVDLRDSLGNPLPGSTVEMATDQGSLGEVVEVDSLYSAPLSPPDFEAGPATIAITAEGATLDATPVVQIESAQTETGGGAGGCPADGNLRVRVVDEAGLPLLGANVMVGQQEIQALYQTSPGATPDGDTTGLTDPDGYIEFLDFGANLDGPLTVTAAADGRRYATFVGIDAADLVLALAPVDPATPTEIFTGDVTNIPAPANDPIELAFMLPDLGLDQVLSFSVDDLLADNECYAAGGAAGNLVVPGNLYFPSQCAVQIFFCLQSLPEKEYTSFPTPYGERQLLALRGGAPLSVLQSSDFNEILGSVDLNGIGVVDRTASAPGPTVQDIPITSPMSANLSCTIDNAPANADVFCLGAGDWDSAGDPGLTPGAGRLFVSGFRLGDAAGQTGPFSIPGVTTVADSGPFAGIDHVGGAIALYNDPAKPGIPQGTADGTSAIMDRSGTGFDGSGGTLTFEDFFPIRTLSRVGRDFTLGPLPGSPHPEPQISRVVLDRIITESYTACAADDSTRSRRLSYWEIFLPGSTDTWTLPTPPDGWPRQSAGGDLAGLVDPAVTPEDDTLEQSASTFHLGTLPGFDYDRLRLSDLWLHLTHVTSNEVSY